jgi:RNA polymerase sigma factor (sigma-70 family)
MRMRCYLAEGIGLKMDVPRFMEGLNRIPGIEWSDEESARVIDWWSQRYQLKLVWFSAARYLGQGAAIQDVEDAVGQFYLDFHRVRRSYRPNDGVQFCIYLLNVCFKNYCVSQGEKIRKRRTVETSLEASNHDDSTLVLEIEDTSASGSPDRQAESRAFLDDLACLLNGALMPAMQKQVFVLRHLREMAYEEIAAEMGVSVGSVKGWLSRATHTARQFLSERGWSQWHTKK